MFFFYCLIYSIYGLSVQAQTGNNGCVAFSTNGIASAQFQYYRLYDFRNITDTNIESSQTEYNRNKTVSDNSWTNDWYVRDYVRASPGPRVLPVDFSTSRVDIATESDKSLRYSTYLTLSTARIDDETQEAGEIRFQEFNVTSASIRVYARVQGASGGVAGIFTYLNDTQESDIEIFTRSPSDHIQYTNQPTTLDDPDYTPIPGATANKTLPQSWDYTDWHVHRLDWTNGLNAFFVNDVLTNSTTFQVPVSDPPSSIYINMWSANSTASGSMAVGQSAQLDIQWIELTFNTTDSLQPMDSTMGQVCEVGAVDEQAEASSSPPALQISSISIMLMSMIMFYCLQWV